MVINSKGLLASEFIEKIVIKISSTMLKSRSLFFVRSPPALSPPPPPQSGGRPFVINSVCYSITGCERVREAPDTKISTELS